MRAWEIIATLVGLGTAAALLGRLAGGGGGTDRPPPSAPGDWVDADAPRRIRLLAAPLEAVCPWPGFGDFLVATAWIESRGNPRAGSDAASNAARGWFGLRPESARIAELGLGVDALKDESDAVALAAWYAVRLRPYASPGQVIDWVALRRGWGKPGKVDELGWLGTDGGLLERLVEGLAAAGQWPDFMHRPAFPSVFAWPGIGAARQLTAAVEIAA